MVALRNRIAFDDGGSSDSSHRPSGGDAVAHVLDWLRAFLAIVKTILVVRNWGLVLSNGIRIRSDERCVFRCRNGLTFHAWGGERVFHVIDILFEILYQDVYGIETAPDDTVLAVDVGAHIGIGTAALATRLPHAVILCFEPVRENFGFLLENLRANKIGNAVPFNFGLHSHRGSSWFEIDVRNPGSSHMAEMEGREEEKMELLTFEDVTAMTGRERIGFMKMDCEGAEYAILESINQDDYSRIETISLEAHRALGHEPADAAACLREVGYHVSITGPPGGRLAIIRARRT